MFGPWLEIFAFLRTLVPSRIRWPEFSFLSLHYIYILTLIIITSVILYGGGNLEYVDCLFFASGASTQSGLNTVNINDLKLYQQVTLMLICCIATPIFIHTFVVFVRLYWFEKRFQNIVLESQKLRRTRERSRTKTDLEERHLDIEEKGFGRKKISVMRPGDRTINEVEEDEKLRGTRKPSDISEERTSQTSSGRDDKKKAGAGPENAGREVEQGEMTTMDGAPPSQHDFANEEANETAGPLHRNILFADEVKPVERQESDLGRMPAQRSAEENIEFLERQRNEGGTGTLYIPGPRDFDRGDKPKQLDGGGDSPELERARTLEQFPSMNDTAKPAEDECELNGDDHVPPRMDTTNIAPDAQFTMDKPKDLIENLLKKRMPLKSVKMSDDDDAVAQTAIGRVPSPRGLRTRTKTFASFLTTRSEERDPMPYLSYQPTMGRNSLFVNLSEEQREELGGIEYRALKLLAAILSAYYLGFHTFAMLCYLPWISNSGTYQPTLRADGINPSWWGVFTAASMFNDLGFTLTPDSMYAFNYAIFILLVGSFLIIIGNTGFPCMLRFVIWTVSKLVPAGSAVWEELHFLLDHPRRCFTLLFPSNATWWLFWVLFALNAIDLLFFIILDLHDETVTTFPAGIRVLNGWFQAASTRTAGFAVVSISDLHPAVQVSYLIMMYISVFPIAISIRRTNVYEERSLGVYNPVPIPDDVLADPNSNTNNPNAAANSTSTHETPDTTLQQTKTPSYVGAHLRRQLSFDLWYVFLGLFVIAIVEGDRLQSEQGDKVAFSLFAVLFEVVSAYGTVGLSFGYPNTDPSFSSQFRTISKLVIIAMQLRGRHRGLPYALDKAILLPGEGLRQKEEEEARYQARVQTSRTLENSSAVNRAPTMDEGRWLGQRTPRDADLRRTATSDGDEAGPLRPLQSQRTGATVVRTGTGMSSLGRGASLNRNRSRGGLGTLLSQALSAGPTIPKRD